MSIQYRFKRSSGSVHESIPAHPDAIYRPQDRPTPVHVPPPPPAAAAPIASHVMTNNAVVAAPFAAAGGGGFSPWWIIGPLLALLAAMALAALAYFTKKKDDEKKKQAKDENEPGKRDANDTKANQNKEKNNENDESVRKLPVENVPLRSMKPDTPLKEQKQTSAISSTAKGNSPLSKDSQLSNNIIKDASRKSAAPATRSPLTNGGSTVSSTAPNSTPSTHHSSAQSSQQVIPINVTRMAKPNSDAIEKSDKKDPLKTLTDSPLVIPLKNIRSVSTHKTDPNFSESSSISSTAQKLDQPNTKSDLNTSNSKLNTDLNKKQNHPYNKSPSGQSLTNIGRVDPTKPRKTEQNKNDTNLPSSRAASKSGDDDTTQPNSPEQHGVGKSPLLSSFPTGSKHNEKEKPQNPIDQTKEEKASLNPNLQPQQPHRKSPHLSSDTNTVKLSIHSKRDPLSESIQSISSSSETSSAETTKEKNSKSLNSHEKSNKQNFQPSDKYSLMNKADLNKFADPPKEFDSVSSDSRIQSQVGSPNLQKPKSPNVDQSDESTTSLSQPGSTHYHDKVMSLLPNVPQCKTNTSTADDDDYDEYYPVPATPQTASKHQKTNSNMNASAYRKKRILFTRKSLTKRFHHKDKV